MNEEKPPHYVAPKRDWAILTQTEEGMRVMRELLEKFQFHQPSFRDDEVITNPAGAEIFAKLRDGERGVLQYILQRSGANDQPIPNEDNE